MSSTPNCAADTRRDSDDPIPRALAAASVSVVVGVDGACVGAGR